MKEIDELKEIKGDFASLARLATRDVPDDVRLFLGKVVRKYRVHVPELSELVNEALREAGRPSALLRRATAISDVADAVHPALPKDADTQRSLVRLFDDLPGGVSEPILSKGTKHELAAIVRERIEIEKLKAHGVRPTRSAILTGPPGVGKTLSARWLAYKLGKPLWILDLTTVMSSLLGRTGNNLRLVFDHAKEQGAVLLLDEIDAIAKRRSDESDIGELKRLVTGLLQEVDAWPDNSLLLAATNHPELIDPALWRRFDAVLKFELPDNTELEAAIQRFIGTDCSQLQDYFPVLVAALEGQSLSDVERFIMSLRRTLVLEPGSVLTSISELASRHVEKLGHAARINLATALAQSGDLSHNKINEITGVARDTIRKHAGPSPRRGRGMAKDKREL
ncbi:AAA family ATPase [Acidovorax sp. NPDC077693]|uniref:AAA family ATPase n=1 Tax=unclassified Acidovorax TaxID=2684926 RepID=UPI0037C75408